MTSAPSHPPTLLTLVRRALRELGLGRPSRVLVAVSGGADSSALLHALARHREAFGFELVAHGVDHGLREAAASELDQVAALATRLEVPFERTNLHVPPGGNLQSRARDARYQALEEAARMVGASCIATGHHKDDRAETVLIRILRGTGPAGLAVLPPRATTASGIDRLRPLHHATRRDVLQHLSRHGIAFATDPSNAHSRFLRARVRSELLPLMTELNAGVVDHLCRLADVEWEAHPRRLSLVPGLVTPGDRAHDEPAGAPAPPADHEPRPVTSATPPRNAPPRRNEPKPRECPPAPPLASPDRAHGPRERRTGHARRSGTTERGPM